MASGAYLMFTVYAHTGAMPIAVSVSSLANITHKCNKHVAVLSGTPGLVTIEPLYEKALPSGICTP
jgi:hypothetical protein